MTLKFDLDARTLPATITAAGVTMAKGLPTPKQLTDGRGLYLKLVWGPAKSHGWRFDFTSPADGKRKTLSLGDYPIVTLKAARELADAGRVMIARGECPAQARKALKAPREDKAQASGANRTFETVAREFAASKFTETPKAGEVNAWSETHHAKFIRTLSLHVFPTIGHMLPSEVRPVMVLSCVQAQEKIDQMETALCVRRFTQQVFDYCLVLDLCEFNPAHSTKAVAKRRGVKGNNPAITTPERAAELMKKIHADPQADLLLMMAYTYQRPGNVRGMEWAHIDLDAALWTIPSADMKRSQEAKRKGDAHVVPLSTQAVQVLRTLKAEAESDARFVFPSTYRAQRLTEPLTKTAAAYALERMGFKGEMTAHGFRAMARTLGREVLGLDASVLEAQLAHSNGNSLGTSYDRAKYLKERAHAVQAWADYLDTLRVPVLKLAA